MNNETFSTLFTNRKILALNILVEAEGLIVTFEHKQNGIDNFIFNETEFDKYRIKNYINQLKLIEIDYNHIGDCINIAVSCNVCVCEFNYNFANNQIVECINYESKDLLLDIIAAKLFHEQFVLKWYFKQDDNTKNYLSDSYDIIKVINKFNSQDHKTIAHYYERAANFLNMINAELV